MIRKNSKVKVHFYDEKGNEIKTRVYGKVFDVVEEKKQIGIMWKEKFKICFWHVWDWVLPNSVDIKFLC